MNIVAYKYIIQEMVYLGLMLPYTLVIPEATSGVLCVPGETELHGKTVSERM